MPFYSFNFILLLAFAAFFYHAAKFEGRSAVLWAGGSVLVSLAAGWLLKWGWLGVVLGQLGFYLVITMIRSLRRP